jgi:hypothetical protein
MAAIRPAERGAHRQERHDLRRRLADRGQGRLRHGPGCRRGVRIGSAKDGSVKYFIPRPNPKDDASGGEGVAADADGNVIGAENVGKGLRKYAKQ